MTTDYLPAWATLAEASQWLEARTGEQWPLPRLIEAGALPHIWLEPDAQPNPAVLAAVFDGRHEGFIAPLVFAGDTHRLAIDRSGAMSMTRTPSGKLVRFEPSIPFAINELRFKVEDVRGSVAAPAGKKWTLERIAEMRAFKTAHGTKATADHYQVSEAFVRKKCPSDKPPPKGYSAFTHRQK